MPRASNGVGVTDGFMELLVRLVEHEHGQSRAARLLHVHPSTVGRWMRGETVPHLVDAVALVNAVSVLGIPPSRAALILLGVKSAGVLGAIESDPNLLPAARIQLARQYEIAVAVMAQRRRDIEHARRVLENGGNGA